MDTDSTARPPWVAAGSPTRGPIVQRREIETPRMDSDVVVEPQHFGRLIVIAGNAAQCRYFCDENGLNPHRDIVYAGSMHALRGLPRGSRFVCVGTYWEQRELQEMLSYLDYLGAARIQPEHQRIRPEHHWTLEERIRLVPRRELAQQPRPEYRPIRDTEPSDDAFSMSFSESSGKEPV